MAHLEFNEFPNLIEYHTTIGNSTLLQQKYTTIKEYTLLKDIEHFMYLTQSYFSDDTPNQILHIMSTLLLFSKRFYTTIGQYPTLYDFLAISQEDLIQWEYHLDNPNTSVNPKIFQPTLLPPPVYLGEVSHHMHDSGESNDLSVCHTTHKTCLSIASKIIAYHWIRTGYNLSDMLSKHWDHPSVYNMIMKLLITRRPITLIPKEATQEKPT